MYRNGQKESEKERTKYGLKERERDGERERDMGIVII